MRPGKIILDEEGTRARIVYRVPEIAFCQPAKRQRHVSEGLHTMNSSHQASTTRREFIKNTPANWLRFRLWPTWPFPPSTLPAAT